MGVADSPDLANLYGYYFERRCKIMNNVNIPFYGRYIDDCLAIVYASSENEARDYIANKVKFDNCTIEWNVSDNHQTFLDMTLYFDHHRRLQHMPYRKAHNHQERIPWISYHPLDVKRGTFSGEMSRLATLSSTRQHYLDAVKSLAALYIHRGYPENVIRAWLKNNITKRWKSRLNVTEVREAPKILVLKTEFNTAWNYFNASELQARIFEYWRTWLDKADRLGFDNVFIDPRRVGNIDEVSSSAVSLLCHELMNQRNVLVPDLRKLDILERKIITSRKRTRNLFDLASLWKKTVLETMDEQASDDIATEIGTLSHLRRADGQFIYEPDTEEFANLQVISSPETWHYTR